MNWLHFVSLIYRKQRNLDRKFKKTRCELTTFRIFDISQTAINSIIPCLSTLWIDYISYLWYIANSHCSKLECAILVVNWLHFVSLIYRKQPTLFPSWRKARCELTTFRIFDISQTAREWIRFGVCSLWIDYISYLWYIANSNGIVLYAEVWVVNWLHFVSLIYRKQLRDITLT